MDSSNTLHDNNPKLGFFLVFMFLLLVFYPFRYGFLHTDLIFAFLLFVFVLVSSNFVIKKDILIFIFILLILYSFILYLYAGFTSFNENGYYFYRIVRSFFIYFVFLYFFKIDVIKLHDLMRIIFLVLSLHMLFLFLQLYSVGWVKEFSILVNPSEDFTLQQYDISNSIRARGLFPGFDIAGLMVGAWLSIGLFVFRQRFLFIALIFIIAYWAAIISSRMGLLAVSYVFFIWFLYKLRTAKNKLLYVMSFIFVVGLIFLFMASGFFTSFSGSLFRAFEPFINFLELGYFSTASSDDLILNHYKVPPDFFSRIFYGVPFNSSLSHDFYSDVGYIQLWVNFGLIPTVFILVYFYLFSFNSYKASKKYNYPVVGFFILFIYILLLVANLKGPYFFGRGLFDLFIIFIAYFSVLRTSVTFNNYEHNGGGQ